jgi:hypothetical protein
MSVVPINTQLLSLRCPSELRPLRAWVVWRYEDPLKPGGKRRKVPYWTTGEKRNGVHGRPEDRAKLAPFDLAKQYAATRGFDGVGFCPLEDFGLVFLDFDDVVVEHSVLDGVERMCTGTYAEYSPSCNGVRAVFRGNLGNRKSGARQGWPWGFETFSTKGFVTFTGNLLPITELTDSFDEIAQLPPDVIALFEERFRKVEDNADASSNYSTPPMGLTREELARLVEVRDPGCEYSEWLEVGACLHHETQGSEEGFEIFDRWSALWEEYPGQELLREKWRSFGRHEGKVVTARTLLKKGNELGARVDPADVAARRTEADFEVIEDGASSDDDFEVIEDSDTPQAPKEKPSRFAVVYVDEALSRPPPEWLVENLLPQAQLAMTFGDPGSGKSFATLDVSLHVAMGREYRGRKVKRQKVVYVVGEGQGSFKLRVKAWCDLHGVDPVELREWFVLVESAPSLLSDDEVKEASREIRKWGGAGLIAIDTLARALAGGNENAADDMGKAIKSSDTMHRILKVKKSGPGPVIWWVHHSGKDAARGARGHSSAMGAVDCALEVKRMGHARVLTVVKQKDGEDNIQVAFELERVQVGMRDDLTPITSCVVKPLDALPAQQAKDKQRALGTNEQVTNEAFNAILAETGETGADFAAVIDKAIPLLPEPEAGKRDLRKQHLERALKKMCGLEVDGKVDPNPLYRLEKGRVYAL